MTGPLELVGDEDAPSCEDGICDFPAAPVQDVSSPRS